MAGDVVRLAGIHHLKLPVRDLARTEAWYERVLGYRRAAEFVEEGMLMGVAMIHPGGGPELAFRLDPDRAEAAAGFDYYAIGVPDELCTLTTPGRSSTKLSAPPVPRGRDAGPWGSYRAGWPTR